MISYYITAYYIILCFIKHCISYTTTITIITTITITTTITIITTITIPITITTTTTSATTTAATATATITATVTNYYPPRGSAARPARRRRFRWRRCPAASATP